ELANFLKLRPALDALGDDLDVQVPRHGDDGAHDRQIAHVGDQIAHEAAVDLQGVDAPALQVRKARVAGTEVVNGDMHAQLAQLSDRILARLAGARFAPFEYRALGEFDLQHRRLKAVLFGEPRDRLPEILALQLPRGHVDGDRHQLAAGLAPLRHVFERALQHELADGHDEAGFLGDGHE